MKKMVVHKATVFTGKRFGVSGTITSTLCGRSNGQSSDGVNSSSTEITCKFCLKLMNKDKGDPVVHS